MLLAVPSTTGYELHLTEASLRGSNAWFYKKKHRETVFVLPWWITFGGHDYIHTAYIAQHCKRFCATIPCIKVWLKRRFFFYNVVHTFNAKQHNYTSVLQLVSNETTIKQWSPRITCSQNGCTWTRRRTRDDLTILIVPRFGAASQAADRTPHAPNPAASSRSLCEASSSSCSELRRGCEVSNKTVKACVYFTASNRE